MLCSVQLFSIMKLLIAITVLVFAAGVSTIAYSYDPTHDLRALFSIIISYDSIMEPHLKYDRTVDDINDPAVESVLLGLIVELYNGLNTTINLVDVTEQQNPGSMSPFCNWDGIKTAWFDFSQLLFNYKTNAPKAMPDKQGRIDRALSDLRSIKSYSQTCKSLL